MGRSARFVVGALHALSNPPPAFTRLCGLDIKPGDAAAPSTKPPREAAPPLEPQVVEAMCRAYDDGEPISHIAKRFGIHRSTFYVRLERAGVQLRPREALSPTEVRQAANLYSQGRSLADVGRVLGVDAQTIRNHLAKAGVPIRKRRGWK
jgi:transposase-like protein